MAGYKVPVPTSSTLERFDSFEQNNRVQFVADQAANRRGFHQSDVKTTSSTASQSATGFRDVILTWLISAFLVHRLHTGIN